MKFSTFLKCLACFGMLLAVTLPGTLPPIVYRAIYSLQIIFFLSSRVQQIMINFKNKSTGNLSPITMFLGWAGNLARLFTLMVDLGTEDLQIIFFSLIFFVFNFTPFVQYIIYLKNTGTDLKKSKEEKKEEQKPAEVVTLKKNKKKEETLQKESKPEQVVLRRKKTKKRES